MSDDLPARQRSGLSRSQRDQRGYRLVVIGGVAAATTVIGAVLAIAGVIGWGLPVIAAAVAGGCALLFRRLMAR